MDIIQLDNVQRILDEPYISWIRDQKFMFESPMDILAKIWSGAYTVYVAIDHIHEPHGLIVCKFASDECTTVLVYAKNQLFKLRNTFYAMLKSQGIKKVKTFSHNRSEAYERLTGMKHIYSYYEKEL